MATNDQNQAVLTERLNSIRETMTSILVRLDGLAAQLGEVAVFRNTTTRDISEMRQQIQRCMLDTGELGRTVKGLGKAFDDAQDAAALKDAALAGQLVLLRWVVGIFGALATPAAIAYLMRVLGL